MYTKVIRKFSKIACAVSGGVDSAVASILLKRKGYEVTGVFMRNWDVYNEKGQCSADSDLADARLVCRSIGIPLHEVNFVKEYWTNVFCQLLDGYKNGITPNPDVLCNKYIKFGSFFDYALNNLGVDAVATGHYARVQASSTQFEGVKLLKSVDQTKDQTMFLSQISQTSLQRTIFPVGDMLKTEVKRVALEEGLDKIVSKKESTGICFIGSRNFHSFIEEYVEPRPGHFIDVETGKIIGTHKGVHYWTVGQRTLIGGLRVAYFVSSVDPETHDVYVVPGTDHPALFSDSVSTDKPHWINQNPFSETNTLKCEFRFQHIHPTVPCEVVQSEDESLLVILDEPLRALTPGQYAALYLGDECLGSAQITKTGHTLKKANSIKNTSY